MGLFLSRYHAESKLSYFFVYVALIMVFFMHLRRNNSVTIFYALSGVIWLVILFGFAFTDYVSRGYLDLPGK